MYPNQMGVPDAQYNQYFNNNSNIPPPPQFNQAPYNPPGYGRFTPHPPQGMNNLPPPLGHQLPSWNNIHPHILPPPTHQAPHSSTNFTASIHQQNSTFPYQMNNPNHRNQFQAPLGPHHLHCPPPPVQLPMPPNPYVNQPASQYMMPQMFQGGEVLHQGCTMPGGPPGAHQSDMFYHNHLVDPQFRHVALNVPSGHLNQRPPPLHHNHVHNFQRENAAPHLDTGIPQYGNNIPWRYDRPEIQSYPYKGFPDPAVKETNREMYDQWATGPSPRPYEFAHPMEPISKGYSFNYATNPARMTPARNVLERNTAANFDESSEELAEIFAEKPSKIPRGSESCSDNSSVRTTSSGYVFYSDDESMDVFPNVDEEMGSKKVFGEDTLKRGQTDGSHQKNQSIDTSNNTNEHSSQNVKPPPSFTNLNEPEYPPVDQLQKVGEFLKGLLKVDVTYCHGNGPSKPAPGQERRPGRKSKSPGDGPTIRSLIDRPIYNNCESRIMTKNAEVSSKEKPDIKVSRCTSDTIKRVNIQRITSHFRVLFEPIPDMFGEA